MDSGSNLESKSSVTAASSLLPLINVETLQSDADADSAIGAADPCVCINTLASTWLLKSMDFSEAGMYSMLESCDAELHVPMCFSKTTAFGNQQALSVAPRPACCQQAAAVHVRDPCDMLCRSWSRPASPMEQYEAQADYGDTHEKQSPVFCMAMKDPLQSKLAFMQSYVYNLLPELKRIHSQPPPFSLKEKLSAVRIAADTSLAISATGNNQWSQALLQHMASLSRSKVRMRGKDRGRKSSVLRRRIYAKILRRSSARASLGLRCHRADSRCTEGSNPHACMKTVVKYCRPVASIVGSSGLPVCKNSSQLHRAKPVGLKRSGLSSYVKALRKSMSPKNMMKMRHPTSAPCSASLVSQEHIASLSRLVPGGCSMDVPLLFEEAADYIRSLQMQVEALQRLSHLISL